ncbi:MAG: hypothetical protein IJR24_03630, partial [Alloprevotella sp.]|nr:hypothetical protein [Alloprevotella sp.]
QGRTYMDVWQLLVEFSRELDAAEALFIQQEPLIFQEEPLIFQEKPLIFRQEPGNLGAESAGSARTFSKLYLRACSRIMRARVREEKWVQNSSSVP